MLLLPLGVCGLVRYFKFTVLNVAFAVDAAAGLWFLQLIQQCLLLHGIFSNVVSTGHGSGRC